MVPVEVRAVKCSSTTHSKSEQQKRGEREVPPRNGGVDTEPRVRIDACGESDEKEVAVMTGDAVRVLCVPSRAMEVVEWGLENGEKDVGGVEPEGGVG